MEAIVLHTIPHTDRASMVQVYSRTEGAQTFIAYGLHRQRKGSANLPAAAFEPLSIVDVTITETHHSLPTIKTAQLLFTPNQTRQDIRRRSVSLFIAELLLQTLRHPLEDQYLFDYLLQTIQTLETTPHPENLHLSFMLQYALLLGFGQDDFEQKASAMLSATLLQQQRRQILHELCDYYAAHLTDFRTPKSLEVLETIFD